MFKAIRSADWIILGTAIPLSFFGLLTMNSFGQTDPFFTRQIIWLVFSLIIFFIFSSFNYRFLKRPIVTASIYSVTVFVLLFMYVIGSVFQGAQSWLNFGLFAIQPSEFAKLALIIVLAKYFSRRHVEIAHVKHIFISGLYAFIVFALVFFQPDFGSAIIIFALWLFMILVSGVSKRHLALVFFLALIGFMGAWQFLFNDYQRERVVSFLHPLADIQGSGYNAYQSTIAVGSGGWLGKGIGYGTQSRLKFLPEYQTDFIFAAFAEEWGFVGVFVMFFLFAILIWRIIHLSSHMSSNFESLFGVGLASLFVSHFVVHIGMNVGLLPVTGLTLPFVSYGGSHLLASFLGLGILIGMYRDANTLRRSGEEREIVGI